MTHDRTCALDNSVLARACGGPMIRGIRYASGRRCAPEGITGAIAIATEKRRSTMASERQREIKRRRKRREKRLKAIVREARTHKKKKR